MRGRRKRTFLTLRGSSSEDTRRRFTNTLAPSRDPSCAEPEANDMSVFREEPERLHDFGSISWAPHILPSSCRGFLNARLAGSEISVRAYDGV